MLSWIDRTGKITGIAFTTSRKSGVDLRVRRLSDNRESVALSLPNMRPTDWSPDGRYLIYQSTNPKTLADLWLLPMRPGGPPRVFLATPYFEWDAAIRPPPVPSHRTVRVRNGPPTAGSCSF